MADEEQPSINTFFQQLTKLPLELKNAAFGYLLGEALPITTVFTDEQQASEYFNQYYLADITQYARQMVPTILIVPDLVAIIARNIFVYRNKFIKNDLLHPFYASGLISDYVFYYSILSQDFKKALWVLGSEALPSATYLIVQILDIYVQSTRDITEPTALFKKRNEAVFNTYKENPIVSEEFLSGLVAEFEDFYLQFKYTDSDVYVGSTAGATMPVHRCLIEDLFFTKPDLFMQMFTPKYCKATNLIYDENGSKDAWKRIPAIGFGLLKRCITIISNEQSLSEEDTHKLMRYIDDRIAVYTGSEKYTNADPATSDETPNITFIFKNDNVNLLQHFVDLITSVECAVHDEPIEAGPGLACRTVFELESYNHVLDIQKKNRENAIDYELTTMSVQLLYSLEQIDIYAAELLSEKSYSTESLQEVFARIVEFIQKHIGLIAKILGVFFVAFVARLAHRSMGQANRIDTAIKEATEKGKKLDEKIKQKQAGGHAPSWGELVREFPELKEKSDMLAAEIKSHLSLLDHNKMSSGVLENNSPYNKTDIFTILDSVVNTLKLSTDLIDKVTADFNQIFRTVEGKAQYASLEDFLKKEQERANGYNAALQNHGIGVFPYTLKFSNLNFGCMKKYLEKFDYYQDIKIVSDIAKRDLLVRNVPKQAFATSFIVVGPTAEQAPATLNYGDLFQRMAPETLDTYADETPESVDKRLVPKALAMERSLEASKQHTDRQLAKILADIESVKNVKLTNTTKLINGPWSRDANTGMVVTDFIKAANPGDLDEQRKMTVAIKNAFFVRVSVLQLAVKAAHSKIIFLNSGATASELINSVYRTCAIITEASEKYKLLPQEYTVKYLDKKANQTN
jgi:hypothetical protein